MLAENFEEQGFTVVPFGKKADVIFINSCTVTKRTDYCCRQAVRKGIKVSPDAFVIIGGCYAELGADEIADIEGVDVILGAEAKFEVMQHLNGLQKRERPLIVQAQNRARDFIAPNAGDYRPKTRAFLKIQDGCDARCSYCAVPLARGKSRSSTLHDVINRAQELAKQNYKEIVLTGVHIGRYGNDLSEQITLKDLLIELVANVPNVRFRLSSLEPHELSCELIECIASLEQICRHLHVPLQSGSNHVLKAMNRHYTREEFKTKILELHSILPEAGIGTDIIVGFPSESYADFTDTLQLVQELPLSYFHVFKYSSRPGTEAAKLKDDVSSSIKKERSEVLRLLDNEKRLHFISSFIGKEVNVLFERQSNSGVANGLTSEYLRVEAEAEEDITNQIRLVRIESVSADAKIKGVIIH